MKELWPRVWPSLVLMAVVITIAYCAAVKPIARTVDDIGGILCEMFAAEHPEQFQQHVQSVELPTGVDPEGLSPAELCTIKNVVQPFIDEALAMKQGLGARMGLEK